MTAFVALNNPIGFTRTLKVDVEQTMRVDMVTERIWRNRHIQHIFDFSWPAMTEDNHKLLRTFFETCRGRIQADIAFIDPFDAVDYVCRLDADTMEWVQPDNSYWTGNLRLVEVSTWRGLKAAVDPFPASLPYQRFQYGERYSTLIQAQEDNSEKRYENYSSGILRWKVGGQALTTAQATTLCEAWEGNAGPWRMFHFTDLMYPAVTYHSRFAENTISATCIAPGIWSCETTVEESK